MSGQFVGSRTSWAQASTSEAAFSAGATATDPSPIKSFSSPAGSRQRPVRRYSARKPHIQRQKSTENEPEMEFVQAPEPESFVFKASGAENIQAFRSPRKPGRKSAVKSSGSIPIGQFRATQTKPTEPSQPLGGFPAAMKTNSVEEDLKRKLHIAEEQQPAPATAASGSVRPPAFVFGAGVAQQQQQQPQPAQPPPQSHSSQPFVFKASQTFQQQQPAPPQQQQATGFVSIKQIGATPRAPLRSKHRRRTVAASSKETILPPTALQYGGTANAATSLPQQPQAMPFQPQVPMDPQQVVLQKAAEAAANYRIAGNEAFRQQQYKEAHTLYTKAAEAIWPYPELHKQLALLLCNRAAANLSLGCPQQALHDCRMGLQHDSNYAKCVLRMSTCHVRMGNFVQARAQLSKLTKAAEGDLGLARELDAKSKEVEEIERQMHIALFALGHKFPSSHSEAIAVQQQKDLKAALSELEVLFAHVPHAEIVHAGKAEALLRLGQFAAATHAISLQLHAEAGDGAPPPQAPWRTWIACQVAFRLGDVEGTQQQLIKLQQQLESTKSASLSSPSFPDAAAKTELHGQGDQDLLSIVVPLPKGEDIQSFLEILNSAQQSRTRGNNAVKENNFKAALEAYSEALNTAGLSAAMAGLLHSNRAAAHQGLGDLSLALADCCRAKALAPNYAKAYSRMATLLTEVQLFSAATDELQTALCIPDIDVATRHDYTKRLKEGQQAVKSGKGGGVPNHYKLLGVDRQSTLDQMRKAYKKLALQLHPDKAIRASKFSSQLLATGSVLVDTDGPLTRLKENATWLFKSLGEAHDVLTNESKRREYDGELRSAEYTHTSNYGGGVYGDFMRSGYGHYGGSGHSAYQSYGGYDAYGRPSGYGHYSGGGSSRHGGASYNYSSRSGTNARGSSGGTSRGAGNTWGYWSYQ